MTATVFDLGKRTVLGLSGPATLKFLNDVSTQDVASLQPGESVVAAFLDDKGRILADARVTATDDGAIVDAVPAARSGLERAVARVAPLAGVEVEVDECEILRLTGAEPPADQLEPLGIVAVPAGWGGDGVDLLAPSLGVTKFTLLEGGAVEGDVQEVVQQRIAAGRPEFGVDFDETTLINETPLLARAVSFTKGCYPGQESVARVHNLGRVRRMLRMLAVDAEVAAGDPVTASGSEAGMITSAAGRFAFARLDGSVAVGERVVVAGVPGEVTNAGWE